MTVFDAIEDALRKDDWWKQLITIIGIPAILSFFAYSYSIGYFMASDISWFTFFTLSDNVRFALRSLPLVAAASIVFFTLHSNWKHFSWLEWPWLIVLVLFAAWSVYTSHIVIGTIIGLMVLLEASRRIYKSFVRPPIVFYWIVNLMVLSIIGGFISASAWMYLPFAHLSHSPLMIAELRKPLPNGKKRLVGRAMFSGDKMILFYEHSVGTHLLSLDNVQHIEQCMHGTIEGDKDDDKRCP